MEFTEVGRDREFKDSKIINFFSNDYFIDTSVLFLSLNNLINELLVIINYNGENIDKDEIESIKFWISRKTKEIYKFYNNGGVVILIADNLPLLHINIKYSSNYFLVDFLSIFTNSSKYTCDFMEGTSFLPDPLVKSIMEICEIRYYSSFNIYEPKKKTLFTTIKSKEIISFSLQKEFGLLFVLPHLSLKRPNDSGLYRDYLIELINSQKADINNVLENAPEWANQFQFSIISDVNQQLDITLQKKELLEIEIKELLEKDLKYKYFKSIIYTKGNELEIGMSKCFEHLGINFIKPPGSNTDLIIDDEDKFFAIEIKGCDGSATKAHVRQLEEWVNSSARQADKDHCKGVLIINAFCNTDLDKRPSTTFPPNVVEFSIERKHCLVTTVTLLTLIDDFDNQKIEKSEILDLIQNTIGILEYTI